MIISMDLLQISKQMRRRYGLNEDIIRFISAKKMEPEWMLEWRLKALPLLVSIEHERTHMGKHSYPPIDYQDIIYYSAPKQKDALKVWMKLILNC